MGVIENMAESKARRKAERYSKKSAKITEKNPAKAAELTRSAEEARREADALHESSASLAGYRSTHPLESQLNKAAMMHLWPKAKQGALPMGPVKGAHAELFNANAHKAWTATRLASNATLGVASGGLGMAGRKNKGHAQINVQLASGTVSSYNVKPQDLRAANRYVMALNAYSEQLEREAGTP